MPDNDIDGWLEAAYEERTHLEDDDYDLEEDFDEDEEDEDDDA